MNRILITLFASLSFCLNVSAASSITPQDDINIITDVEGGGGGAPDLTVARNCETDCTYRPNTNIELHTSATVVKPPTGAGGSSPEAGDTGGESN